MFNHQTVECRRVRHFSLPLAILTRHRHHILRIGRKTKENKGIEKEATRGSSACFFFFFSNDDDDDGDQATADAEKKKKSNPTFCFAVMVHPASVDAGVSSLSRSLRTSEPVDEMERGPDDIFAVFLRGRDEEEREEEKKTSYDDGKKKV